MLKNKKILYTTLTMMIFSFILSLILFCGCGSGPGTPGNSPNLVNISTVSTSTPNPTAGPVEITPTNGPTSTPTVEPTVGPTATPTVYIEQNGRYYYIYNESNLPKLPSGVTPADPTPTVNPNNCFNAEFTLDDSSVSPVYNIADLNIDSIALDNTDGFPGDDVSAVSGGTELTNWVLDSSYTSGIKIKKGDNNLASGVNYEVSISFNTSHTGYFFANPFPELKLYLFSNGAKVGHVVLRPPN